MMPNLDLFGGGILFTHEILCWKFAVVSQKKFSSRSFNCLLFFHQTATGKTGFIQALALMCPQGFVLGLVDKILGLSLQVFVLEHKVVDSITAPELWMLLTDLIYLSVYYVAQLLIFCC